MGKKDYTYLIGTVKNKIECIGIAGTRLIKNRSVTYLKVKCKCGHEYEMRVGGFGYIKECRNCSDGVENVAHRGEGLHKIYPRIYRIYHNMKRRCVGKSKRHQRWYSEKGIKVCEEWDNSFVSFKDWALSNGYADNLTLDRKKGELGYSPSNCRWITQKEQTRNTKSRKEFDFKGVKKSLGEWEECLGLRCRELRDMFYHSKYPKSVEYIINKYEDKINAYISANPHELVGG